MKKPDIHFSLFIIAAVIFLILFLLKIEDFPIYFFTDEAALPVKAEKIIKNGFKDGSGTLFPLMIETAKPQPGLIMYLQMPFVWLFGKKIWVIRSLNVFITLAGCIFIALTLKNIFKSKNYWLGILFPMSMPILFIHARAEFNSSIATAFYAISLYFYLLYRTKNPKYLLICILFISLSIYSYFGIWLTLFFSYTLLLIFDLKYHFKNFKPGFIAIIFLLLLLTPLIKYELLNFAKTKSTFIEYNFDLARSAPLSTNSLKIILNNYFTNFNPLTLFREHATYLKRHVLKGSGYFPLYSLPMIFLGILFTLRNVNNPIYKILLIILFTSPVGTLLVGHGATRILPMIIPLTLFFAIGIKNMEPLLNKNKLSSLAIFLLICASGLYMTYDSLKNGPLWFNNYGLYGQQYGAKQLFQEAIPDFLQKNPETEIFVSPNWANGVDVYTDFFLKDKEKTKVKIKSIEYFIEYYQSIPSNLVLIMIEDEIKLANKSKKFKAIKILKTVPCPDKTVCFYFAKVTYTDGIENIFKEELRLRRQPVTDFINLDGEKLKIVHSRFEVGSVKEIFDEDQFSFARGWEANPMIVEIYFSKAKAINSLKVNIGIVANFNIKLSLYPDLISDPLEYSQKFSGNKDKSVIDFNLKNKSLNIEKIKIEIKEDFKDLTKIHLFDIRLN